MFGMIRSYFINRKLICELAMNDLKARFSNSIFGILWTIVQPLINMLVIWLVFQVGFKSSNLSDDTPFIVWYMPAFLIWNFFSEATSQATNSFIEYSYLIKKVNFTTEIIHVIKVVASAIVHSFFILFIIFVNICYGYYPQLSYFQVLYYFFAAICFALALGILFGSMAPYAPDVNNLVAIAIQIGFWVTPIFWDPSNMHYNVQRVLMLNPMYYICQGYRESFIYGKGFWTHPGISIYFWSIVIAMLIFGIRMYKKASVNFDDVL